MICGYRVEEIADPLLPKIRYLDKLVDELAKANRSIPSSGSSAVAGFRTTTQLTMIFTLG